MHSTAWGRTLAATHCGTVTPLRGLSSPSVNRVLGLSHYSCSPWVKGTCTSGVMFCGWGPPPGLGFLRVVCRVPGAPWPSGLLPSPWQHPRLWLWGQVGGLSRAPRLT